MMSRQVMYCHTMMCTRFSEEQIIRFTKDSWVAPGEWVDEPECRECGGELREHPRED